MTAVTIAVAGTIAVDAAASCHRPGYHGRRRLSSRCAAVGCPRSSSPSHHITNGCHCSSRTSLGMLLRKRTFFSSNLSISSSFFSRSHFHFHPRPPLSLPPSLSHLIFSHSSIYLFLHLNLSLSEQPPHSLSSNMHCRTRLALSALRLDYAPDIDDAQV